MSPTCHAPAADAGADELSDGAGASIATLAPGAPNPGEPGATPRLILCGHPNVGKSLMFNRLTGSYHAVSNFPGTTVEVSSGTSAMLPGRLVCDTPGAYSLLPISEEERVARRMLMAATDADLIVHIVDAKSLRRMLPMTLELLELGKRVVLALNLMDEARTYHVSIDARRLGELLGIPVVATVATTGEGVQDLLRVAREADTAIPPRPAIAYDAAELRAMADRLDRAAAEGAGGEGDDRGSSDASDEGSAPTVSNAPPPADLNPTILLSRDEAAGLPPEILGQFELGVRKARQAAADRVLVQCASFPPPAGDALVGFLDRLTLNPWTAVPVAAAVLYFGVYQFVGVFGAGTLVNWIEQDLYNGYVTPWLTSLVERTLPWPVAQDLFVHDYGMLTLGLRYAIALILPIVGSFFIVFSVLEDSGYLPRLALLLDRVFKKIGLNGRAVIPIVLGFGCGTMATVVTRVLETRRERIITTLLLGVAVPCSAQLGFILGILGQRPAALVAWGAVMATVFLLLGFVAAARMPGEPPAFYLEMPPLRIPRIGNVLTKTYTRMHWYFLEILPLFLLASVIIWVGNITGAFQVVVGWMKPAVRAMGLPDDAASALLFGFFRRDYAGAGLMDLQKAGKLDARQSFVAVLVISLLLPCVAQFFVMKKERGWTFAGVTMAAIVAGAAAAGVVANQILTMTGWMR